MRNNSGTTVGCYTTSTYESHAFTSDGHTFTNIDVPGGTNQCASSISSEGYVVGNYADASGATVGFVRDPKRRVTDFTVPDALYTVPDRITDNLKICRLVPSAGRKLARLCGNARTRMRLGT